MCSDFKNAQVGWQTANPNSTVRVQFRMKLVAQSPYKDQRWTHKTGFARNWDCIANAVKGCSDDIPNANDPGKLSSDDKPLQSCHAIPCWLLPR